MHNQLIAELVIAAATTIIFVSVFLYYACLYYCCAKKQHDMNIETNRPEEVEDPPVRVVVHSLM